MCENKFNKLQDEYRRSNTMYIPWKLMKHINNNGCPPQKIIGWVVALSLSIYLIVSRHISFTSFFHFNRRLSISSDACRNTINQCYQILNIVLVIRLTTNIYGQNEEINSDRWNFNNDILCLYFCNLQSIFYVRCQLNYLITSHLMFWNLFYEWNRNFKVVL